MGLVGTICVETQKLKEKSEELKKVIISLKTQSAEAENIVNVTAGYWMGKAGDSLRKQYSELNADINETLDRLAKYPADLQMMAGIYDVHDADALQKTEALPAVLH